MSARRPKGFTVIELVVVILAVVWVLIFLVPLLGTSRGRRNPNIMREGANLRNIHAAMAAYATANKDWFPGVTSTGKYAGWDTSSATSATDGVAASFIGKYYAAQTNASTGTAAASNITATSDYAQAVILDEGATSPEQWLSPGETGGNTSATLLEMALAKPSTTGKGAAGAENGEVTRLNNSHALLQYGVPSLKNSWKSDQNQMAVVMGTRLIFTEGADAPKADAFNTVWTDAGSGQFRGSLVRGDSSSSTESFKPATLSATFGTLKYFTPETSIAFSPSAHDATAVGAFGKSGPGMGNFEASANKGQIGSGND